MKIAVVTCTGGRPELFALCRRWVEKQTVKPDLWIVGTDTGDRNLDLPPWATHQDFKSGNVDDALSNALSLVPPDHAAIVMEDDDYYGPQHIEKCMERLLAGADVTTGEVAMRWHLPAKRWAPPHFPQPLIQGTIGIRPEKVQLYRSIINKWDYAKENKLFKEVRYPGWTTVGIKGVGYGLPGRAGYTNSHNPEHYKVKKLPKDHGLKNFRSYLGADAEAYIQLLKP